MTLLAFDIGNTNVVIGAFDGEALRCECRLRTDTARTRDEYAVMLLSILERRLGSRPSCTQAVVSSVVPPLTPLICEVIEAEFGLRPLIVGPGMRTGIAVKTTDPSAVGADRIVNAVAVKHFYGLPALAVDFGTATSIDYVDRDSNYHGGVIAPGLEIALDALVRRTAKLPKIEMAFPQTAVGRNTVQAMQSGTVLGYQCLVDGLIDKIVAEVGPVAAIVATGGAGRLVAQHMRHRPVYDPHLTLKGLQYLAALNAEDGVHG